MATQRLLPTTCQGSLGIVGQHTVTVIRIFHQCELKHLNTLWLTAITYLFILVGVEFSAHNRG